MNILAFLNECSILKNHNSYYYYYYYNACHFTRVNLASGRMAEHWSIL